MIWLFIPVGWVLATITIAVGFNRFLKAERGYFDMLDRASERARQRVEREMRPPVDIEAEREVQAAYMRAMQNAPQSGHTGLAWAQQNALMGQSQNMLGQYGAQNAANGYFGPSLGAFFARA